MTSKTMVELDMIEGWLEELWQITMGQDPRINGTVERELLAAETPIDRQRVIERHNLEHQWRTGQRMAVSWIHAKIEQAGWRR